MPDLTDVEEDIQFRICSQAEAVQAANVTPNFNLENPFEGLVIDSSTAEQEDVSTSAGFTIRYENSADNIVNASELFGDIGSMMPGDIRTGSIRVKNSNSYKIKVTLTETGSQVNDLLLKVMKLSISKDGNELYSGSITDNALVNGLSLGDFAAGTEQVVDFKIELPISAENETAYKGIDIVWTFSAERVNNVSSGSSGSSGNSGSSSSGGSSGGSSSSSKTSYTTTPVIYSCPDGSVKSGYTGGHWNLLDEKERKWEYVLADGTKATNGWMYLYNSYSSDAEKSDWFCFNENGIMQFGWVKTENGNWYFCNEISDGRLGRLMKGWHTDADDGRIYYLDPVSGIMQTGWREIDGKFYYFAASADVPKQNWFWNTGLGKWVYDFLGYRTYGSLYQNEETPDGYQVDESGIWDGKAK